MHFNDNKSKDQIIDSLMNQIHNPNQYDKNELIHFVEMVVNQAK